MIIDTLEITGFKTPIGLTFVLSDFIVKNFPSDYPRNIENNLPDFEEITDDLTNLIEIYNSQFKNGLKSRKNFMAYNQWLSRRTNYQNWSKFAAILDDLASDLGPYSHSLINTVVDKIDSILAHELLNSQPYFIEINEFDTSALNWAQFMFRIPRIMKIVNGKPRVIKGGTQSPVQLVLKGIMPLILKRESNENTISETSAEDNDSLPEFPSTTSTTSVFSNN
jgi:hypothetical protein